MMPDMTPAEIVLFAAALAAAAPFYLRGVRATAQGSLACSRFALCAEPEGSGPQS